MHVSYRYFCALLVFAMLSGTTRAANYYVNDASRTGDVYCTATGTNLPGNGVSSAKPMLTLSYLLTNVTISPGDVIYVDSGFYTNQNASLLASMSGSASLPVTIQGSTNALGQRTVFDRNFASGTMLTLQANVTNVWLRNLEIRNAENGILLNSANANVIEGVTFVGCTNAARSQGTTADNRFSRCLFVSNSLAFELGLRWRVDQCVLYQNTTHFKYSSIGGGGSISNSIAIGGVLFADRPMSGDYNVLWNTVLTYGLFSTLDQIQAATNDFFNSIVADPFLPATTNIFDMHLPSVVGRYNPGTGAFVTDLVHSVAVDFADPARTSYTNEPAPNGGRLNAGQYGGMSEASKSRTNVWLRSVSYNDGGIVTTQAVFRWLASALFTNGSKVRVDYSPNNGVTWSNLASGIPVTNGLYTWNNAGSSTSAVARWRVVSESGTNVFSTNDVFFVAHNAPLKFYVNDSATNGDVYCTAVGSPANNGLSPASPLPTVQAVLDTYQLSGGDTIYVDAGVYTNTATITFADSGSPGNPVVIQGSTNHFSGRTLFQMDGASRAIVLSDLANHVKVSDLYIRGATFGVFLSGAYNCEFDRITVDGGSAGFGHFGVNTTNHLFSRCLVVTNSTAFSAQSAWRLDRCVLYNNTVAFQSGAANSSISNSVIIGGQAFPSSIPSGDYCVFWNTTIKSGFYTTLGALQKATNSYAHSTYMDPQLIVTNLDFHERSAGGRFDPATSTFVLDTTTSVCVDFGDPTVMSYMNEVAPNGARLNAGLFGGTSQASKTPTNGIITALSFNDGGTMNLGDTIYWRVSGVPTSATVRIEYSGSSGASWQTVTSGIPAYAGFYTWVNTNFASSSFARWRVIVESSTNLFDAIDNDMIFRNGPFAYFVNDSSAANDVFCTALGNDANLGTDAGAPKASLAAILSAYDLEPGDIVYVDTGNYNISAAPPVFLPLNSGVATNPVIIQGSPNLAGKGAVFNRGSVQAGMIGVDFNGGSHIVMRNITVSNANVAIRINSSPGIRLQRVRAVDSRVGLHVDSSDFAMENCEVARNLTAGLNVSSGSGIIFDRGVFWSNQTAVSVASGAQVGISNSAFYATGQRAVIYEVTNTSSIVADYNNFDYGDGARFANIASMDRAIDTLSAWTAETGQGRNSTEFDSLFADPSANDFHLKSQAVEGRVDPQYGLVTDTEHSPLIDAGNPAAAYSNEPAFNGGRLNLGSYGNHVEASKSLASPRLSVGNLRRGGFVKGAAELHWVANSLTNGTRLRVDYSPDGGETWVVLTNGIPATNGMYSWSTTGYSDTPSAIWRVTSTSDTNLSDRTPSMFSIRNAPLSLFINDASTLGDTYCTGPGAETNFVAARARPMSSLDRLLDYVDLEPGDTVYVDSGNYTRTNTLVWPPTDAGSATGLAVSLVGSTNSCGMGTVFTRPTTVPGSSILRFPSAVGVAISNVTFQGGNSALWVESGANISFGQVRVSFASNGVELANATNAVFSRVVASGNYRSGLLVSNSVNCRVENSVIISNAISGITLFGQGMTVSNSFLGAADASGSLITVGGTTSLRSDYNNLYAIRGAAIARIAGIAAKTVTAWSQLTTNDLHSLSHDPLFADAGAGDYHLQSEAGRLDPGLCAIAYDSEGNNSPMIDAGAPTAPYANEPAFNGGRMNIGLYGNTTEASRSMTNAWLRCLSLNDGGSVRATNALYWDAYGFVTNCALTIQFSPDAGATWTNIATNVAASSGVYPSWNSTNYLSTPIARWRIFAECNPLINDTNDANFSVNNGALSFYVNDGSTNCDVYCTAPGDPSNDGLTPASPKSSPVDILASYPMAAGNTIYVDSGEYALSGELRFDALMSGSITNPISLVGSTNGGCGGTVFYRSGAARAVDLQRTAGIRIKNIRIAGPNVGVRVQTSSDCVFEGVQVDGQTNYQNAVYGFEIMDSTNISLSACVVKGITNRTAANVPSAGLFVFGGTPVRFQNGVLWSNRAGVHLDTGGGIRVTNSILSAFTADAVLFRGTNVVSDYNDLFLTNGAAVTARSEDVGRFNSASILYDTVASWTRLTGNDRRSLSTDPRFADEPSNDYHLLSQGGRFTPSGSVVMDAVTSALIDAGPPTFAYTNEPSPNGKRINIGPHGNTTQASYTPTNPGLAVLSFNDGGRAEGAAELLSWVARGAATGHAVRLQYSADAGSTWLTIVTNLPPGTNSYTWNTMAFPSSARARWRVLSESNLTVLSATERNFVLHNTNLLFYVNDAVTNGDVYCTKPGASTNNGVEASSPMASLEEVLNAYDLEPGDTVYVDTGSYSNSNRITISNLDSGQGTNRVRIIGSTNVWAGGAELVGPGIRLQNTKGVELRSLRMAAQAPFDLGVVSIAQSTNSRVFAVSTRGGGSGFEVDSSTDAGFDYCVASEAATNGIVARLSANIYFNQGVLWSNRIAVNGAFRFSNSVAVAYGNGRLIYNGEGIRSDYNALYVSGGALIGSERLGDPNDPNFFSLSPTPIQNLGTLVQLTGRDAHSLSVEPGFANAVGGDFHLMSSAGRYQRSTTGFVNDASSSSLIDAASPSSPFAEESAPNGARANIGVFGNTFEASRTATNAGLQAISFNDGGNALGTNVLLYWFARGAATGGTVRIELSADAGDSWSVLASNVSAASGEYVWDTTTATSTVLALWRVVYEPAPSLATTNGALFAIRNVPMKFYVNDSSTNGDVFCQGVGLSGNRGIAAQKPKASIQDVLDTYDLEPGDTIYVDTGYYMINYDITVGRFDAGSLTNANRILIVGSTNEVAGGTVIDRMGGAAAFRIPDSGGVELRSLKIRNADTGVLIQNSPYCLVDSVDVKGGAQGIYVNGSSPTMLRRVMARNTGGAGLRVMDSRVNVENCLLWSNRTAAIDMLAGTMGVTNTILGGFGASNVLYQLGMSAVLQANYNDLYVTNGALVATWASTPSAPFPLMFENVARWTRDTGLDRNSLSHDPRFADPVNDDFHLKSTQGRWVPASGSYTQDVVNSPLIDAGDPLTIFTNEPSPNGLRINIGPHGNLWDASLTPTGGALVAVSLNDGGRAEGAAWPLTWVPVGVVTGHRVRVEYSADSGASWMLVVSNLPARAGSYTWDTRSFPSSMQAYWRIASEDNTNIFDQTDNPFALRNTAMNFYVNDALTNGDVYTTAPGHQNNTGLTPASPLDLVQSVLDRYDLEPGDTIWVDTMDALLANGIVISRFDAWDNPTNLTPLIAGQKTLTIRGSTNYAAGGTIFRIDAPQSGIAATQALGVVLRDLKLIKVATGSGSGLSLSQSSYSSIRDVTVRGWNKGFDLVRSSSVLLQGCVAIASKNGFYTMSGTNVVLRNSVLWSNNFGIVQNGNYPLDGSLTVENTALNTFGSGNFGFYYINGARNYDYNNLYTTNGAMVGAVEIPGNLGGGTNPLEKTYAWLQYTGQDRHSLSKYPHFADPNNGDFHLLSPAGRYVQGVGFVTNATEILSPLVDTGNPNSDFSLEPAYNGTRVNIGNYGNSPEASKTPSNGVLRIITLNDGFNGLGTVTVYWAASGFASTNLVTMQYSSNGGATWSNIFNGLLGSQQQVDWNTEPFGRACAGRLRIFSNVDTNVTDMTEALFSLRNGGSIPYYVNATLDPCDIYTTVAGQEAWDGCLPSQPKPSLQSLIDSTDLEPGDVVYVDSGTYQLPQSVLIGVLDAGSATNPVIIQGSTNFCCGGTIFAQQAPQPVLRTFQSEGISIRDITVRGGTAGIQFDQSANCSVIGVVAQDNTSYGFQSRGTTNVLIKNSIAYQNGKYGVDVGSFELSPGSVIFENGVAWGQDTAFHVNDLGDLTVRNSAAQARGDDGRIFLLEKNGSVTSNDYNNYIRVSGALVAEQKTQVGGSDLYGRLSEWRAAYKMDNHTLSHDPKFVNESGGDFRLRSTGGHTDACGVTNVDVVSSPMLDTGDPATSYTNEPAPNGGRVNIGAYGGRSLASRSPVGPWLLAISPNDGGLLSGTQTIYWASGNMAATSRVTLAFATDGVDFNTILATNLPASQGQFVWDMSSYPPTFQARWKVISETYPGVEDTVDNTFGIKNSILTIYVNDEDTFGDVFCTGPGNATNPGTASQPLLSPLDAMSRYVFGPGDTLYIDAGEYYLGDTFTVGRVGDQFVFGISGFPFRVRGTTTGEVSAVLHGAGPGTDVMALRSTRFIDVDQLKLDSGYRGLALDNVEEVSFSRIETHNNTTNGISVRNGARVNFTHSASWDNRGLGVLSAGGLSDVRWMNGVIWSNDAGGFGAIENAKASLRNSILEAVSNAPAIMNGEGPFDGDYNFFKIHSNGFAARDSFRGETYRQLAGWQTRGSDRHSLRGDPLFADEANGDFHLMSQAGRYQAGSIVTDVVTSLAIDTGDPASTNWTSEPEPNGGAINMGMYGGTPYASMSYTNSDGRMIYAASLDDGGMVVGGTTQLLYWVSRGLPPSCLVDVYFSTNGGHSFAMIGSNISITAPGFEWVPDSLTFPSTPRGIWRVATQCDTNIFDTNSVPFTLRMGPIFYYVNDDSTNGDVYCTAVGAPENDGLSPGKPRHSLASILDEYDLDGTPPYTADVVFVDSGVYAISNASDAIMVLNGDGGTITNKVRLQGSTNALAPTTIRVTDTNYPNASSTPSITFFSANNIAMSDFVFENAGIAISMEQQSRDNTFTNILIRDFFGSPAIRVQAGSSPARFHRLIVTRGTGTAMRVASSFVELEGSVIWDVLANLIDVDHGALYVSNSILQSAENAFIYLFDSFSTLASDYNDLFMATNTAKLSKQEAIETDSLLQWQSVAGQDIHSLSVDPLFANATNDDFHLQSPSGRYVPALKGFVTNDTAFSYLIDAGPTNRQPVVEPMPNGGRMNIGAYGQTGQASKSRTNAWLMAATGNSGGRGEGILTLVWNWGNIDPTNNVDLYFSHDGGPTWVSIGTNIPLTKGEFRWNTYAYLPLTITPAALWRVQLSSNSNIQDVTDSTFILNGPITFYLNDNSLMGDIYTTAVGNDTNVGWYAFAPKATLRQGLLDWPVFGGDTIQFDVGTYPITTNDLAALTASDQGNPSGPVYIRGAGNRQTTLQWAHPGTTPTIFSINGSYVSVTNLVFIRGGISANGTNILLTGLNVVSGNVSVAGGSNTVRAITVEGGSISVGGSSALAEWADVRGLMTVGGRDARVRNNVISASNSVFAALTVSGTNLTIQNNTALNERGSAFRVTAGGGTVYVRNNIFVANAISNEAFVIERQSGALNSDYNNLVARNGAWIGNSSGNWERLVYWQQKSGQDQHSISRDPLFANEPGRDYHLRSLEGRYQAGIFVLDAEHSPSIDAGDPATPYSAEYYPNGGRVNQGAYGGTLEASMSRTDPWVQVVTADDGGVLKGANVTLNWRYPADLDPTNTITLQYSANGGVSWTTIAANLALTNSYVWNSTNSASSFNARWRVLLNGDVGISDTNKTAFSLRNTPQSFYVNDGSTSGDVYTTAIGASGNNGTAPATPKSSLADILTAYDLEGGDIVYVDTGSYTGGNVRVNWSDGGDFGNDVIIQGSTQYVSGGTVLARNNKLVDNANGIEIYANSVKLRDLTVRDAYNGILFNSNRFSTVERSLIRDNMIGFVATNTLDVQVRQSRFWNQQVAGVSITHAQTTRVENITFVSNVTVAIVLSNALNNTLQNNIFYMFGQESNLPVYVYAGPLSVLDAAFIDYNNYYFDTNALSTMGIAMNYESLGAWRQIKMHDYRSAVTNPQLANVASGDFHLKSKAGRYVDGVGFVTDSENAWGLDKANPLTSYTNELAPNGSRANIGAYGGTAQASKSFTNVYFDIRTANNDLTLTAGDSPYLLQWYSHQIPSGATVRIEYSGDLGLTWGALATNVSAYQEYFIWTLSPNFNTYGRGKWRVIMEQSPFLSDTNDARINMFFGAFQISEINGSDGVPNSIKWRGAWGEEYQVQYATDMAIGKDYLNWSNAPQGVATNQKANFISTRGGDFFYEDYQSVSNPNIRRLYRVILNQDEK